MSSQSKTETSSPPKPPMQLPSGPQSSREPQARSSAAPRNSSRPRTQPSAGPQLPSSTIEVGAGGYGSRPAGIQRRAPGWRERHRANREAHALRNAIDKWYDAAFHPNDPRRLLQSNTLIEALKSAVKNENRAKMEQARKGSKAKSDIAGAIGSQQGKKRVASTEKLYRIGDRRLVSQSQLEANVKKVNDEITKRIKNAKKLPKGPNPSQQTGKGENSSYGCCSADCLNHPLCPYITM